MYDLGTPEVITEPTETTYKNNPILIIPLNNDGTQHFRFGKAKANAIVKYIDDIRAFAEK